MTSNSSVYIRYEKFEVKLNVSLRQCQSDCSLMGRSKGVDSPCRIPRRSEQRVASPPMQNTSIPTSNPYSRPRSASSRPNLERSNSVRYKERQLSFNSYKQPTQSRTLPVPATEISYLPPPRGLYNRQQQHQQPSFDKDFGPFGTVHKKRHFNSSNSSNSNTDTADINSMFRRPEYENQDRLAGSFRVVEGARSAAPMKGGEYGSPKTWDTGEYGKDNGNPLLRSSQLPPPNQPIVNGSGTNNNGTSPSSSSRRSLNRTEDLDRILAKYGKQSKSTVNDNNKDPDFASIIRTDTTFRVSTTDRYCKPPTMNMNQAPDVHPYWEDPVPQQDDNDLLSKLNSAMRRDNERTNQLPGPDGQMEKDTKSYTIAPAQQHSHTEQKSQDKNRDPVVLRRSTHVFPFKETPSGHLVIDPVQIAFESRKISVLVSDPNNNTHTVEFTTTKCGTNGLMFQSPPGVPYVNKNERILHEVKKAMSIQETNEIAVARNSNSKLPLHQLPRELNQKRYSDSKKATEEFEQSVLNRVATGRNADTHVMIGDKIYPCHSLALEAFSTYFERLSRSSDAIQRIQLPEAEVSVNAFPVLMDWILQSEDGRKDIITKENLVAVYSAARHLGIRDLELQCTRYLERKVDPSDPDLMNMWDDVKRRQATLSELVRIIAGKMASSYHDIYRAKRFLQMDVDELYMLLSSDDISIDSEMDVYDSAVSWLLHDWKNRKVHTNKIMSTVRFGLLTPLQLTQINLCPEINKVKNEKDYNQIVTYGTVKSMIDEGLSYSILDESYKNQPDELKKWVEKTGVKGPAPRTCLVNRKRGSPMILDKIASLEGASQTKIQTSFHKIPVGERSSSYTLLTGAQPKPGTPQIDPSVQTLNSGSIHSSDTSNEGSLRGRISYLPRPRGLRASGSTTDKMKPNSGKGSLPLGSHTESGTVMQELSKPKELANSNTALHTIPSSETDAVPLFNIDSNTDPTANSFGYEQLEYSLK